MSDYLTTGKAAMRFQALIQPHSALFKAGDLPEVSKVRRERCITVDLLCQRSNPLYVDVGWLTEAV